MKEKDDQLRRFEELRLKAQQEEEEARVVATMADFEEDWNHSQVDAPCRGRHDACGANFFAVR